MHVRIEQILDLVEGSMNTAERPILENHLLSCSECATEFQSWSALLAKVKRSHLVSAPQDAIVSAKQLLPTGKTGLRHRLRQIVATVVFDSFAIDNFAEPAIASVRAQLAAYDQIVLR